MGTDPKKLKYNNKKIIVEIIKKTIQKHLVIKEKIPKSNSKNNTSKLCHEKHQIKRKVYKRKNMNYK